MAQQAVVTDYFTRKRQRSQIQASKRKRVGTISSDVTVEGELCKEKSHLKNSVEEIKIVTKNKTVAEKQTRVTRSNARKTKTAPVLNTLDEYISPKLVKPRKTKSNKDIVSSNPAVSVTTAAIDDHNIPTSPKRSHCKDLNIEVGEKRGRVSPKEKGYNFEPPEATEPNVAFAENGPKLTRTARKRLVLQAEKEALQNHQSDVVNNNTDDGNVENKKPNKTVRSKKVSNKKSSATAVSDAVQLAEKLLLKKKESKETVQESLKKQGNLKDLQDTLLKMRDLKRKTKKPKAKKPVEEKKEIVKKKEYAYSRLHSLAQEIPKGLSLPFKYKILQEMFRSADTVIGMLFNRQETATWTKVQQSVKDMICKNFEKTDVGKIKTVFPEAYLYRQEKDIPTYSDHVKSSDYQLTLEPILDDEECDKLEGQSLKLTSSMLVKRRHHFHLELLNIVKGHHRAFLHSIDPEIKVDEAKIRRWHPQFLLDQVPEVPTSDLPLAPNHDAKRCQSAKDVLDKAKDRLTKKAVEALKKVAEKCVPTPEKQKQAQSPVVGEENNNVTPVKKPTQKSSLKGVSGSLLAKIREKEADKKLRNMIRSDEDEKKISMLKVLPDLAKALRMLFLAEKKSALPFDYVTGKLCAMSSTFTVGTVDGLIHMLASNSGSWAAVTTVRKQEYVRMDKNVAFNNVLSILESKLKEAERS